MYICIYIYIYYVCVCVCVCVCVWVADKCFIPALFAHADGDDFVLAHHSKHLYERYSGDKNIITFGGDHNSPRPAFFFVSTPP